MTSEFYGATLRAVAEINQLLKLPATSKEQDWEFEFADPKRIPEILTLLSDGDLDVACRSALALLLLASIEEAEELGILDAAEQDRAARWFLQNDQIRERMHFYWIHLRRATKPNFLERVIGLGSS